MLRRKLLTAGTVAILAIAVPAAAATWSKTGSGSSASAATTLGAPTNGSAGSATATSLALSWSAPSGAPPSAYAITRNGSTIASGGCTSPVSAAGCTDSGLTAGQTYTYVVTSKLGNAWVSSGLTFQGTTTGTFTASSLSIANGGGTAGRPDANDIISIGYNAALSVSTVCNTWTPDTSNQSLSGNGQVTVTITNNAGTTGNDVLSVSTTTGCTVHFGTVDLGSNAFVTATTTFSGNGSNKSTIAYNATTHVITIVLGSPSQTASTVGGSVTATYTPDAAIKNTASVAISGTVSSTAVQF